MTRKLQQAEYSFGLFSLRWVELSNKKLIMPV